MAPFKKDIDFLNNQFGVGKKRKASRIVAPAENRSFLMTLSTS